MRKTFLLAITVAATTFAFADSWTGKLLDASCYDRMKDASKDNSKSAEESCVANPQSTAFVLSSSGKIYRLDAAGNTRAAAAMKNHAERSAPAAAGQTQVAKDVMARVEGNETAGTITVTDIDLQ